MCFSFIGRLLCILLFKKRASARGRLFLIQKSTKGRAGAMEKQWRYP